MTAKVRKLSASEEQELRSRIYINRLLAKGEAAAAEVKDIRLRRLALLLIKHAIPTDAKNPWFLLSYELAIAHYPGFQVTRGSRPKSGPTMKWTIVQQETTVSET